MSLVRMKKRVNITVRCIGQGGHSLAFRGVVHTERASVGRMSASIASRNPLLCQAQHEQTGEGDSGVPSLGNRMKNSIVFGGGGEVAHWWTA